MDVKTLDVDILLLPVSGFYTFGPEEALAFAKQFGKVGKVWPMHYETKPETREQFIKLAIKAGFNTETAPIQ
jgi:L-ascorbate metabolism protein UlaG (beta-lactamase superfamily)